jgi:PhzF family phenazine biosynthesis protein
MKIQLFQVDAFTNKVFGGNPAAICPLQEWISDELMQKIASETNLSDTGFFVEQGDGFHIRWFTPVKEVPLCGHATLAAAYVIFFELGFAKDVVEFESLSGKLRVKRDENTLQMDLPANVPFQVDFGSGLGEAIGESPKEVYKTSDGWTVAVFEGQDQIQRMSPDLRAIVKEDAGALIATAPGDEVDFVSRVFAPVSGIPEDPVTGSAHCVLVPLWAEKMGKDVFKAVQLSKRRGELACEIKENRVFISGNAVGFSKGEIYLS